MISVKNKVLITTNPLNHEGGVVGFYNLLLKHFQSNDFVLRHFNIGSRDWLFYYPFIKRFLYPFYLFFDVFRYIMILIFDRNVKIIQVNPSLIPVPLIRDGIFIVIGIIFKKKIIVFYHGWKSATLSILNKNVFLRFVFNLIFQRYTHQIVLANSFKKDLTILGNSRYNINILTTAIDRNEIVINEIVDDSIIKVLYLGRVQNLKGIDEIIEAIVKLKNINKIENFHFTIVGHEEPSGYINKLLSILKENDIDQSFVEFLGRISGKKKFKIYSENQIFLLPSYTEGCPISVLEALASGLFCITTGVGALSEIIENNINGLLVTEKSSDEIVKALLYCENNRELLNNRAEKSILYSQKYDIQKIILDFNSIYSQLIHE